MLTGQKHRADSDSRSEDVRECDLYSELRHGGVGGNRSWSERRRGQPILASAKRIFGRVELQQLFHAAHVRYGTGVPGGRERKRAGGYGQRTERSRIGLVILVSAAALLAPSCGGRHQSPQTSFDDAYKALLHGDLKQAQDKAHRECQRFQDSSSEWAWQFR